MENNNQIDDALIAAYRQQSAPAYVQHELLGKFEATSRQRNQSRHLAALTAVFAICAVVTVIQLKPQSSPSGGLPNHVGVSFSTASIDPLPTLSSFRLGTTPSATSVLNLRNKHLTGAYRKTINLANDIL